VARVAMSRHTCKAEIDSISVSGTDLPEQMYNLGTSYNVSLSTRAKWKSACPDKEASVSKVLVGAAVSHMEFDGAITVRTGRGQFNK
jgi:hypothetical protein